MADSEQLTKELFARAIELPPSEWPRFLDEHCPDPEVRQRVERLLNRHSGSGQFLERPAVDTFPELSDAVGGQVGEFRIVRVLGRGGMGIVYLAEDTVLKRAVALKILPAGVAPETDYSERFRKEAQAAARLSHPGIVQIFRTGDERGHSYIAMEYVDGKTLRDELLEGRIDSETRTQIAGSDAEARPIPDSPLASSKVDRARIRTIARLVSDVAEALDHAHRQGVIHRDVKPSNIMIDREGRARLTDFGIARILSEQTLSSETDITGSYSYMSPEQARVQRAEIDHRSDIFSLGVVLYEALTGVRPFDGATPQEVFRALTEAQPKNIRQLNRAVPPDLATICHKAIEKLPSDRYQTAAHMAADLRCFIAGTPILARPQGVWRRLKRGAWRYRRPLAGVTVILLAGGVIWETIIVQQQNSASQAHIRVGSLRADAVITMAPLEGGGAVLRITPNVERLVPPGRYRVVVESRSAGGFAERTLNALRPGQRYEVEPQIRPTSAVTTGMVLIAAGKHALGEGETARDVALSAFWIDLQEVSNAEYQQFVQATGWRKPYFWHDAFDPALAALPVVGVTYSDAAEYAAWAGKRLPTADEWEAAGRAPDGWLYPWGSAPGDRAADPGAANAFYTASSEGGIELYRKNANATNLDNGSRTGLGLLNMLGNVAEVTDSFDSIRGVVIKGGPWYVSPAQFNLASSIWLPQFIDPRDDNESRVGVSADTGFRCAKSDRPISSP